MCSALHTLQRIRRSNKNMIRILNSPTSLALWCKVIIHCSLSTIQLKITLTAVRNRALDAIHTIITDYITGGNASSTSLQVGFCKFRVSYWCRCPCRACKFENNKIRKIQFKLSTFIIIRIFANLTIIRTKFGRFHV